jgi:hypothetical protein
MRGDGGGSAVRGEGGSAVRGEGGRAVRGEGGRAGGGQHAPSLPWLPPRQGTNLALDPETAERSLVALVLTVVELLRELMERQAVRRFDQGDLSPHQVEQLGTTLMALDGRMSELCDHFGLTRDDLNLDLGPLGPLLGRD